MEGVHWKWDWESDQPVEWVAIAELECSLAGGDATVAGTRGVPWLDPWAVHACVSEGDMINRLHAPWLFWRTAMV